jgi:chaperonin GroEL (HSP60 family)
MNRKKEEGRIFHSIGEFERNFFPKSFEKKLIKKSEDSQALGISLAKESLEEIRRQLAK